MNHTLILHVSCDLTRTHTLAHPVLPPARAQIDALQQANATLTASNAAHERELGEKTAEIVRLRDMVQSLQTSVTDAKALSDALQARRVTQRNTVSIPSTFF